MSILKYTNNTSSYRKLEGALDSGKLLLSIFHAAAFKSLIVYLQITFCAILINAQQAEPDFKKILRGRSVKIVNTLEINDSTTYYKVVELLTVQYFELN